MAILNRTIPKIIIFIIFFIAFFPLYWTLTGALKLPRDISSTPVFIFTPTLDHFFHVLTNPQLLEGLLNSAIIVGSSVGIGVILGVPAAYILSSYNLKLKENFQFYVLSIRFLPPIAIVIPFISIWLNLGLLDTRFALTVTYLIISLSTIIWLSVPSFEQVPTECEEAAVLEGCSPFEVFYKISLPIAFPTLLGGFVFTFILLWNELLIALALTSNSAKTLPVAAQALTTLGYQIPWGRVNAVAIILSLPPLIFIGILNQLLNTYIGKKGKTY